MSSLKPYQSAFNALRSILNYLPEHLPSSRHLAGGPSETFIPVPFWVPDIIVAGILVVVAACVGFGIWKTKKKHEEVKKHEEAKKRRLNVVQKPQELDVYDVPGPFAENVKIILQMFVGVGLAGIIILKILDFLGLGFDIAFLRDFVYHRPTLLIVGVALAYSSAIELAYMKLADYCGKIRRIMLHKLQIAGQSTRFAPIACDTRAFTATTSCIRDVPFGVLFDSRWVCEASYGSKIGFFEPYCGNSGALLQWIIEKVLDSRLVSGTNDSLPRYASQIVLTANICYRSVCSLLATNWLLS